MRNFLEQLTKEAGNHLKNHFKNDFGLVGMRATSKEAATKYDKILDKFIVGEIQKKYPEHSILSEEGGFKKGSANFTWIVDSLDGTSNFANRNPLFSVCIAVMENDQVILGAICAPLINEFYIAQIGKGAFLNGKQIKVSEINDFSKSYLVFCEGGEKDRLRQLKIISALYPAVTDARKIGSAGIETAWVALGRAEGYFTTKIEPWDVAPGVLLVKEAGGKVSDFKGNDWLVQTSDLVFSNSKIHDNILNLIQDL